MPIERPRSVAGDGDDAFIGVDAAVVGDGDPIEHPATT
jgi:hypothetical protein